MAGDKELGAGQPASEGLILPGYLLTNSSAPGHAMGVLDSGRATGAVLGKILTELESGTRRVLALVAVQ